MDGIQGGFAAGEDGERLLTRLPRRVSDANALDAPLDTRVITDNRPVEAQDLLSAMWLQGWCNPAEWCTITGGNATLHDLQTVQRVRLQIYAFFWKYAMGDALRADALMLDEATSNGVTQQRFKCVDVVHTEAITNGVNVGESIGEVVYLSVAFANPSLKPMCPASSGSSPSPGESRATDNYVLGDLNSNSCPAGSSHVTTRSECRSAFTFLSQTHGEINNLIGFVPRSGNWGAQRPTGCFVHRGNDNMHFNGVGNEAITGGNLAGNDQPVCKTSPSGNAPQCAPEECRIMLGRAHGPGGRSEFAIDELCALRALNITKPQTSFSLNVDMRGPNVPKQTFSCTFQRGVPGDPSFPEIPIEFVKVTGGGNLDPTKWTSMSLPCEEQQCSLAR